jgi:hypothetical protein
MFSTREASLGRLRSDVSKAETKMALIRKKISQRKDLEKRSLPTDDTDAHALYQEWLWSLVGGKLGEPSVGPVTSVGRPKSFDVLAFQVKGKGSLEQVIRVLYDFYSAGHLHQITSLSIKPIEKTGMLDLDMKVEAVILPGANRKHELATEKGDNLVLSSFEDYQQAIQGRNLFAEYAPPTRTEPVVARAAEPTFDLARLAFFTSLVEDVHGRREAWLTEKNANKRTALKEGDEFEVAGVKGTVKHIDIEGRSVELEIDGKPVTVMQSKSLGDTLAERQKTQ